MREVFETCVEYLKLNYSRNSERLLRTPVDEKGKGRAGEGGGGGRRSQQMIATILDGADSVRLRNDFGR